MQPGRVRHSLWATRPATPDMTAGDRAGRTLVCADRRLCLDSPAVMGVLNITPDSFSDGGRLYREGRADVAAALAAAEEMQLSGAAVIDIGGESTRPGAEPVSAEEEEDRVLPVVSAILARLDVLVSVDTSNPAIMLEAARQGAHLINDVRALTRPGALQAAASTDMAVCLMHMQGSPANMQQQPCYRDPVAEVAGFLHLRAAEAEQAGIDRHRLLLDPGFGFGKTAQHNLLLLARLCRLKQTLDMPLLVGLSRKSTIGEVLGREPGDRLYGSLAAAVLAVAGGADMVRTHDVQATRDAVKFASRCLTYAESEICQKTQAG